LGAEEMRQLTKQQKKYLDQLIPIYAKEGHELVTYEDLYNIHWKELEHMNDTEILWQEVNRYLWDKRMEKLHG
jgi:hypothetical protein